MIDYYTIQLCWCTTSARREYMSYDQLNCLSLDACPEIERVVPLEWEPEDIPGSMPD
jgi:hypothetical protein